MLPLDRRKEILQLCSDYNLIVLEDDPYFYLQFEEKHLRPPSLFSLDTEGRVIRFDSFSKILSSGVRLGFVTGPKELIQRIVLHMQVGKRDQVFTSKYTLHCVPCADRWTDRH